MPSNEASSSRLGTGRIVAWLVFGTLVFLVAALVAPWMWQQLHPNPATATATTTTGLPWQVEALPDGSSRVFGLHLGHDRLASAHDRWPDGSLKLALVRDGQGGLALEAYLDSVRAGFVQGKLVLTGRADTGTLQRWAARTPARDPQPSGTWRLALAAADEAEAGRAVIAGLVFLPAARFDEATAVERFGPAPQRLTTPDGTVHLLYPAQGVVIALDPQGRSRPVLQYVAPAEFARLREPLTR